MFSSVFLFGNVDFQTQLFELDVFDFSRAVIHRRHCRCVLRECNDFPDCIYLADDHAQTVDSRCDASVRGRREAECVKQEAETFLSLLVGDVAYPEDPLLQLDIVDSY